MTLLVRDCKKGKLWRTHALGIVGEYVFEMHGS